MRERVPVGVVTKDGDRYVGTCEEFGTTSCGQTVAEAFAQLRAETWRRLEAQGGLSQGADGGN